MTLSNLARPYGGVAYREEDRGDEVVSTGGSGSGTENKLADELAAKAAKEAEAAKVADAEKAKEAEATKAAEDAARAAEKAAREAKIAVPKVRFDEAVGKERERAEKAERRLAEIEAARESTADVKKITAEVEALQDELDKALADNNPSEKKRIRAEIRAREEALIDARVTARSSLARAEAVEQVRYDSVVDRVEEDYPFLAEGAEDFDADLTGTLLVMKRGYEAEGLSSSEALKRTVRSLKPQLEVAKKSREKPGDPVAQAAAEKAAAEAKTKAEKAEADRREKAVAAGAAANKAQPAAKTGEAGTADKDIKQIDVTKLSEKDYDKLPEDELKRLRGDTL